MKQRIKQLIIFITTFILVEIVFRLQANTLALNIPLLRSITYAVFLGCVLTLLNSISKSKIVTVFSIFIVLINNIYAFIQIGMYGYYESFFSTRILNKDIPQVQSYAMDFFNFLKYYHFVYLLIFMAFLFTYLKNRRDQEIYKGFKNILIAISTSLIIFLLYLGLLTVDLTTNIERSINLFKNPYYTETAMNQLGIIPFFTSDIQYIFFPNRAIQKLELEPVKPGIPTEPEIIVDPFKREIDDSEWINIMEQETNEEYRNIDQYFLSQKISDKNEMTGLLKDKNLIYFLVEAFDELAIHKDLTPTLYKMKMEGLYFNNFNSTQFNCATAESELISQVSTYPVIGTCTMASYYKNASPQTLYNLFKESGYSTSSFHNWNDQFYPRTEIHPFLGSNRYKDVKETIPSLIDGWQSDLTMMKTVVNDLNNTEGKFMSHVLTSTTHFPYDKYSNLGEKHVKKVRQSFPNAPMDIVRYLSKSVELDLSIQYLIENLESMDNTALIFYSDHTPFRISVGDVYANRTNPYPGKYKDTTPMMIYSHDIEHRVIETVSGTIDLAPTIANLFDLNYDPRLYMGTDIFSNESPITVFQSGSWRDDKGSFNATTSTFTPYDESDTYTPEALERLNKKVKDKLIVSSQTYLNGYYHQRQNLKP